MYTNASVNSLANFHAVMGLQAVYLGRHCYGGSVQCAQKYTLPKFRHLLCNLCLNVPKFRHLQIKIHNANGLLVKVWRMCCLNCMLHICKILLLEL